MRTSIARKFTLVDAMVLIAATAIAFVPIRFMFRSYDQFSVNRSIAEDDTLVAFVAVHHMLLYIALALSLALWILRLRKPRPVLRRIFRQPGMAASTAAFMYTIFVLIGFIVYCLYYLGIHSRMLPDWDDPMRIMEFWRIPLSWIGNAVALAWMSLWLSGAWRSEASWIDRAGRGLGIYWVSDSVLFGWQSFMV